MKGANPLRTGRRSDLRKRSYRGDGILNPFLEAHDVTVHIEGLHIALFQNAGALAIRQEEQSDKYLNRLILIDSH